jgi:hypothetical protein
LRSRSYGKLVIALFFALILTNYSPFDIIALSTSPSFVNQQINDPAHDIFPRDILTSKKCSAAVLTDPILNITDISGVVYSSDGKILNAALWLADKVDLINGTMAGKTVKLSSIPYNYSVLNGEDKYLNQYLRNLGMRPNGSIAFNESIVSDILIDELGPTYSFKAITHLQDRTAEIITYETPKLDDLHRWIKTLGEWNHTLAYSDFRSRIPMESNMSRFVDGSFNEPKLGKFRTDLMYRYFPNETLELGNLTVAVYSMLIDVDSVYEGGTDYMYTILADETGESKPVLVEIPHGQENGDWRLVSEINRTDSLQLGVNNISGFVDFSLDLGLLNFPQVYKIFFSTQETYEFPGEKASCTFVDITDPVVVPPPQVKMQVIPSSVTMETRQTSNMMIVVNSSTDLPSVVQFDKLNEPGLGVKFVPAKISVPPRGMETAAIEIESLENKPKNYIIQLVGNVTFPSRIISTNESFSTQNVTGIAIDTYSQVNVVDPKSYYEQFMDLSNNVNQLMKSIEALFATVTAIGAAVFAIWVKFGRQKK